MARARSRPATTRISLRYDRLQHYFSTCKLESSSGMPIELESPYGAEHAFKVIQAAMADYEEAFPRER